MKREVRARWSKAVLVCAKCSKKLDGGFGGSDKPLAKALRKHLKLKNGPKGAAGVVEVKCLDVCPKGAVVVVDGARPGEWLLVRPGDDLDAVAGRLGLGEG
ncbi:(2Fe-2S) ferredoxin domain-containing protein [Sphingomonas sp. SAFR-052]|uniref:(2Fe-2S) ferredoxin domain-containing protein n=1 Tax=Sphingomonas sp. SAFR-052 TaxID=3436867 RepID=UPI003F802D8A